MKLVRQKHSAGCGSACLAMVANISYRQALRMLLPQRFWWFSPATVTMGKVSQALDQLNIGHSLYKRESLNPNLSRKMILAIPSQMGHHAVVWCPKQQKILDPLQDGSYSKEYCFGNFAHAIVIE